VTLRIHSHNESKLRGKMDIHLKTNLSKLFFPFGIFERLKSSLQLSAYLRGQTTRTNVGLSEKFSYVKCSISPTYLCAVFTTVAPKSVQIQTSHQYLFMHLGSTGAKAAHRTLMKLTPGIERTRREKLRRPTG